MSRQDWEVFASALEEAARSLRIAAAGARVPGEPFALHDTGEYRPALLTVPEAAEELRLSRTKTWDLIASGDLPSIRIGSARRVIRQDLMEWLARQRSPH